MRVWRWSAVVLAWLLGVALVAAATWFAVDSAGREVVGAGSIAVVQPVPPRPTGSTPAASATAGPSPTAVPTAREVPVSPSGTARSPSTGASPAPPGTGRRTPGAGTTPAPGPSDSPSDGPTGGPVPPSPSPPPDGTGSGSTGTWRSDAGELVVRCGGSRVEGWGVRPADGWRVDAAPGPRGALVVVFTSADGRTVQVTATCQDGVATFEASPQG